MQNVNNRGNQMWPRAGSGIWEFSVLAAQYFCKSKTALKISVLILKKLNRN